MIGTQIAIQFEVRHMDGRKLAADELHAQGERLMAALLDLEKCNDGQVTDSTTSSDATRGTVLVELMVTADDAPAAIQRAYAVIRTAVHTVGGVTPWDKVAEPTADYRPRNLQLEYV